MARRKKAAENWPDPRQVRFDAVLDDCICPTNMRPTDHPFYVDPGAGSAPAANMTEDSLGKVRPIRRRQFPYGRFEFTWESKTQGKKTGE